MKLRSLDNKKAQLGLDTVKAVMIAFLVISVLAVTLLIVLPEVRDVAEEIDRTSIRVENTTTLSVVNESGAFLTGTNNLLNCRLGIEYAANTSGNGLQITTTGNYTTDGCRVVYTGTGFGNDTVWNITGTYTFSEARATEIMGNVTEGSKDFFNNTGTIFAILVVVVIILAIAIIIGVVSAFGGGRATGSVGGSGGGKGFGSETVMGV